MTTITDRIHAVPTTGYLGAEIVHRVPGRVLEISGSLGVRTSAQVRSELVQAIADGTGDLIVELAGAELHDSTGLGVLVGAHHTALRCGRRIVIGRTSERTGRVLRATKLHRVLARVDSVEALAS